MASPEQLSVTWLQVVDRVVLRKNGVVSCLSFCPAESRFQSVKQALHTAVPERLLSREAERASIRCFLEQKVLQSLPGSLYISGAPGTGKTACLNCVLQEMKVQPQPGPDCGSTVTPGG